MKKQAVAKKENGRAARAQAKAKTKSKPKAASGGGTAKTAQLAASLKMAVDNVSSAVMMVDRDFVVTYANQTTMRMLEQHAAAFRQLWPGFDAARIIGTCIDMFHKNPAHQRQLLADPSRLPYRTDIRVGPLRFALCVNAILDPRGNYTGNILEWADVTAIRKQEETNADQANQIASISKYQAIVEYQLDGTILSANENFLAASGYSIEEIRGKHHSMFVDPGERMSPEYRLFWQNLARGEAESGQYRRIRKDGRELYLQASYNPILDLAGQPARVIEYANDITAAKVKEADQANQLASISKHQGVIEFQTDGTIVTANANFLEATGYALDEIQGKHHSMFVDPAERSTPEYRRFWDGLARGEAASGQFRRLRKDGDEVWLQASYNPITDLTGKVVKVIKYGQDITAARRREADQLSQLASISKYQAVIEFKLDGTIVTANENFLAATGYTLDEIRGKHHSLFVDAGERSTPEYRLFWERLARGEADGGQYRRIRKDGRDVWLQASYNPILDLAGKPVKVIKYANDITVARQKEADQGSHLASLSKYQSVIEFKLDGTIVTANENFLRATGYTLAEIEGRHHSIFVSPAERTSEEYRRFWERLGQGQADGGQYRRIRKDGQELWLQASYNPITDLTGKAVKVVKYANDITAAKRLERETERAMKEAGRVLAAMAEGDLRPLMEGEFDGEFATLRDAVNGSVTNVRSMVAQIRQTAGVMAGSAGEIAQGNSDLSSRTEQQAASIEETAASMEELTSTVRQNADNARQANQLAGGARDQAEKGGAVVGSAISAMSSINEASRRIADIIGVIDEIAFQTNLLALNAAVEAARAGEQGRGFAVVAAEVRNLAQRSAGAAKEIKTLIKDSVIRVEEGSRLVNDSGATLEQIVQAVKKVSDIIAEIAEASAEQSTGIERVGGAITQMDQAVQQNAALVEEASAAATSLSEQAQSLNRLVAFFNTGDPVAEAPPRAAASSPAPAKPFRPAVAAAPPRIPARALTTATGAAGSPDTGSGRWEEF